MSGRTIAFITALLLTLAHGATPPPTHVTTPELNTRLRACSPARTHIITPAFGPVGMPTLTITPPTSELPKSWHAGRSDVTFPENNGRAEEQGSDDTKFSRDHITELIGQVDSLIQEQGLSRDDAEKGIAQASFLYYIA